MKFNEDSFKQFYRTCPVIKDKMEDKQKKLLKDEIKDRTPDPHAAGAVQYYDVTQQRRLI